MSAPTDAAIAAHRFGLGEAALVAVGSDPRGWLLAQLGPADIQRGEALPGAADGIRRYAEFVRARRNLRAGSGMQSTEQQFVEHFRALVQADVRARLATAATTTRPFAERLALFWANHFTVSIAKPTVRGLAGAFEREAIRPHVGGRFETLLKAAVTHPAMLGYLDNNQSAGPHSRLVQRLARRADGERGPRVTGLNENLAREVLELHTMGARSGYTQADVTAFAAVLTGWRVPVAAIVTRPPEAGEPVARFDPAWHEPGDKTVLGRVYREGPGALDELLRDLAAHPATATFIATKLARHFVADEPPAALVDRLAASYRRSGGELGAVYRTLIESREPWSSTPAKLKTPEEFVVSTARVLGLGEQAFGRQVDGAISALGQRVQAAPSPAGWPDRAAEWLGPDAVWKRVEWASRVGERLGRTVDARAVARVSLGPLLGDASAMQIERAADGPQALTLLLMAPEFQRR
jgi:uncharacterized protein (DUF1800 family)